MATVQTFNSFDTTTLAHFKDWAQAIGSALSSLGWVKASDNSPASMVNWSNVVDVPASNIIATSNWSFTGNWTQGNSYTGGSDVAMYDPGSGAVAYQCIRSNNGTLSKINRQTSLSLVPTSVDAHSGSSTTYHFSSMGGGSNAYAGWYFTVAGCDNALNNGNFFCQSSTATTIVLQNVNGLAETPGGSPTCVSNANTCTALWSTGMSGTIDSDFIGQSMAIAGFVNSGNNGNFTVVDCAGVGSVGTMFTFTNASGVTESHSATVISRTDPSTSSGLITPLWAPYYYEIWKTNDALSATCPIYLRLVYFTQNSALNGTGTQSMPRLLFSVGTRVVNGFLAGNTLNGANSAIELTIAPGSSAGGSSTFENDFSGDAGSFSMHMWRNRSSATWTFVIDRGKNSGGTSIDTYFTVLSVYNSGSRIQQQLFKQAAGTRCPDAVDNYWETINGGATSYAQNGLVPAFPIFPIIGYLGNPLLQAVTIPTGDSTADGEQISVSVYGAAHTYMVSQHNTVVEPGNLNPAILWE